MTMTPAMSATTVQTIAIARIAKSFSVRGCLRDRGTSRFRCRCGGDVLWQVVQPDERTLRQDDGALDDVLQLADVSGPGEVHERPQRIGMECHHGFAVLR